MRRISLALALVVSALVAGTAAHAATRPLHSTGIAGILKNASSQGHVGAMAQRLGHRETAMVAERSRANQTYSTLLLPSSAFSPGAINTSFKQNLTVNDADSNWFRSNHSASYGTWGFQFGAYQRADWNATSTTGTFRWQGSYMNSSANAAAAFNDGVNYISTQAGGTPAGCSSGNVQCSALVFTFTDSNNENWTESYVVLQYGQCLGEITADVPTLWYSTYSGQINTTVSNINRAGLTAMSNTCGSSTPQPTATPTPPPTQTVFSLLAARFEKPGAQADYQLTHTPVTQAKVGSKVVLAMYVNVASLGSAATMTREYTLKRNGATVLHYQSSPDSSITDVDTYQFTYPCPTAGCTKSNGGYKLAKPGNYTFTASVTFGGKTQSATSQLKAVSKVATVKKVSFAFDSLQTQTDSGQTTSTFHTGQSINLHLGWTVKNLKGHTQSTITRSLLANLGGQWKAVNTSHVTSTTVNGKNSASVSLQISSPGTFQVAVRLSVGSGSQLKKATVTVVH